VLAAVAAHIAVAFWARHEFSQVESIVALHANMLLHGEGLYYRLNAYPFTVSPYGPIFYVVSAGLHGLGVPVLLCGRLISVSALLAALHCAWRLLGLLVADPFARMAGMLLAASSTTLLYWGTVGQTDMLACAFSVAAFLNYSVWREQRTPRNLVVSGFCVVLAVFTKQTAIAAGATIALCLLVEDRRRAVYWITLTGAAGAGLVVCRGVTRSIG
jgi:hypothetical protein